MEKSFDDFWNGFNHPKTPLAKKVVYIRNTNLEDADITMLEEFVLRWTEDNNDPLTAEECALEEIVIYLECAKEVQEQEEIDTIAKLNEEDIVNKLLKKVEKDKIISLEDFKNALKK